MRDNTQTMKIMLAPMEGVVDYYMRDLLTDLGGYDACVTEFIRVVGHIIPDKVFYRFCPELKQNGHTKAGTPVIVQLLGSDPSVMADNACRAVELGAPGIDLNFGCPAKCVNKKAGGAFLLQEPDQLFQIIQRVRNAVEPNIPVSAKIRLGYQSTDLAFDNALAVQAAGADYVTVHARTKTDGYKAPARWEWLGLIKEKLDIPVIANGDINSVADFKRCLEISQCNSIMIGRGAVARPDLARQIKQFHLNEINNDVMDWEDVRPLIIAMAEAMTENVKGRFIVARIKQWLVMLKREFAEAQLCFDEVRKLKQYSELQTVLKF